MANIIKIKRGLSTNIPNASLEQGELAITTDTNELYVGTEGGKEKLTGGGMDAINIVADSSITTEKTGKVDIASIFTGTETKTYTIKGTTNLEQAVIYCGAGTVKNMMSEPQEDLTAPSGATIIYTNKSGFLMSKYGIYLLVYDEENSMCFGVPYEESTLYGFSEHKYEMVPCTITDATPAGTTKGGFTYDEANRVFKAIGEKGKDYKTTLTMTGNAYSTHIIVRPNQQNEHGTVRLEKISNGQSESYIVTETTGFIPEYITIELETGDKLVMTYEGNFDTTSDDNVEIFFSYYRGEEQHTTATLFYINNLLDDIHFQLEANTAAAQKLDWEKEWRSNKTTIIDVDSTDEQYPTAKAVYDFAKPMIKLSSTGQYNVQTNTDIKFIHELYNHGAYFNNGASIKPVRPFYENTGILYVYQQPGLMRISLELRGRLVKTSTSAGDNTPVEVCVKRQNTNGESGNVIRKTYNLDASSSNWEINIQEELPYEYGDTFSVNMTCENYETRVMTVMEGTLACETLYTTTEWAKPYSMSLNMTLNPSGPTKADVWELYSDEFSTLIESSDTGELNFSFDSTFTFPAVYLRLVGGFNNPKITLQSGCCITPDDTESGAYKIVVNSDNATAVIEG